MLRAWTGLTLVTLVLVGGAFVAAQEAPKKEVQPPVTDTAVAGKTAGEATKPPEKNTMALPVETRSGPFTCDVHVDNRTSWIIHRVYIDDTYWGAVGRRGDLVVREIDAGRTKVYAEADFEDGSRMTWGPRWFECNSYMIHRWTLGR